MQESNREWRKILEFRIQNPEFRIERQNGQNSEVHWIERCAEFVIDITVKNR
jgi:hypothetical protein